MVPEMAFPDADCSYESNEIAINWNALLVYLAHAVEALQDDSSKKVKKVNCCFLQPQSYNGCYMDQKRSN
jgi:hypothetical protein